MKFVLVESIFEVQVQLSAIFIEEVFSLLKTLQYLVLVFYYDLLLFLFFPEFVHYFFLVQDHFLNLVNQLFLSVQLSFHVGFYLSNFFIFFF